MFIFETETENWTCDQVVVHIQMVSVSKCFIIAACFCNMHALLAGPLIICFCSFYREMAEGVRLKMLAFASPTNILYLNFLVVVSILRN